jgi:8-oxo-dGTP diphosphatase
MRPWTVAGALIRHGDGMVLVANRRRDGSVEWTPPGGVVDAHESVLDGLRREVAEETGMRVDEWAGRRYTVRVEAPAMGWRMRVEAWEVRSWSGDVAIDDPDGIVEEVVNASKERSAELLALSPPWVAVPVGEWLAGTSGRLASFHFRVHGSNRSSMQIERLR